MRDVAALAGVSLKTVSRVVNAEAGVSSVVREKVERAVAQLGYRHNLTASNLRRAGGRTGMVGALLQDVSNSFSASLLRSLEDLAHDRGVAILASSLDEEADRERSLVASLVERRVDGLVIMPATDRQDYLADEVSAGLPVVFVDRLARGIDVDSVVVDNRGGARAAAEHFVRQGHQDIAMLIDLPTIQTAGLRQQGFREGLADAGISLDPRLCAIGVRTDHEAEAAVLALLDLDRPPTAIFAARNSLAIGAVRGLQARAAWGSVALVGFDDFPLADLLSPRLTVVRQDVRRIGTEVGRMLFERLDGESCPPRHVVIEASLVQRGSGEVSPR